METFEEAYERLYDRTKKQTIPQLGVPIVFLNYHSKNDWNCTIKKAGEEEQVADGSGNTPHDAVLDCEYQLLRRIVDDDWVVD